MEAEKYPHTGRIEEDSIGECFVLVLVVFERRCIDEGYYLCLFGDYNDCSVPWEVLRGFRHPAGPFLAHQNGHTETPKESQNSE